MRKMMNRPEVLSVLWHQEAAGLLLLFPGRAGVWSTEVPFPVYSFLSQLQN